MQRRRPLVLITVAAIVLAACTGDDEAQPTTTPAPTTTTPPTSAPPAQLGQDELADALASRNPAEIGGVRALVEPGSPADRYLAHQAAARSLLPDAERARVRVGADTAQVCEAGSCITIADLVTDPATGLLSSFSVDGVPIDARVAGPGLTATVDGLAVTALSTVESVDGVVTALIETRNDSASDVEWFGFAATYATSGGARMEAAGTWGPAVVGANTIELMLISFPDSGLPGRIAVTGLRDDDIDVSVTVEVPAPT